MTRPSVVDRQRAERRTVSLVTIGATVLGLALFAVLVANILSPPERDVVYDASLPNPMGGPATTAPGQVAGEISFGGLTVAGVELEMGDVALGVTYVPSWEVVNTTAEVVEVEIGMPQVVEGCCPGPIYADGELTQVGQRVAVPAGGSVELQFPLQMHAGMDGPHHLVLPLATPDDEGVLHVSGNFTARV